jgi:hypothetical protein
LPYTAASRARVSMSAHVEQPTSAAARRASPPARVQLRRSPHGGGGLPERGAVVALRTRCTRRWRTSHWFAQACERIGEALRESGVGAPLEIRQLRSWASSCVLTVDAPGAQFYFKALASSARVEAAVVGWLAEWTPSSVPRLVAVHPARRGLPGDRDALRSGAPDGLTDAECAAAPHRAPELHRNGRTLPAPAGVRGGAASMDARARAADAAACARAVAVGSDDVVLKPRTARASPVHRTSATHTHPKSPAKFRAQTYQFS